MHMKRNILIISILLLAFVCPTSCLKSYVENFDNSSAERMETFLSDVKTMLISEPYGWQMDYYVGNEEGERGGINLALKFGEKKDGEIQDTVRVMSEEDATLACTSRYVLRSDSGPVLSFDTHNEIMHKYGTASSDYYEGRGGDFEFFITGYDKTAKTISLKGKRSGKTCEMHPLGEDIATFNARMYDHKQNFYISTFDGFIGDKKVTGAIDVTNRQFTAYEMEEYGKDDKGNPLYDIAETRTVSYILTDKGIRFYEPLEVFNTKFESFDFNYDISKSDTTLTAAAQGVTFKAHIPEDWLPYEFYEGNWGLTYEGGTINITLVPEGDKVNYRIKNISPQFELLAAYDIKTGRIGLRYQAARKPGTNQTIVEDDHLIVVMVPWAASGSLWMNYECGMDAVLKTTKDPVTGKVDREASLAKPVFNWKDAGLVRTFITTSFLMYYYETDDTADSAYAGQANQYKFTGGSNQLSSLKQLIKK